MRVLSTELAVSIKLSVCERSPSPFWFFLTRFDFIIVWIMVIIANYNLLFRLLGATFFIWRALECTVHCFRMHAFAIQLVINWIYSWHVSLLFRFSSSAHTGWTKKKKERIVSYARATFTLESMRSITILNLILWLYAGTLGLFGMKAVIENKNKKFCPRRGRVCLLCSASNSVYCSRRRDRETQIKEMTRKIILIWNRFL